VRALWTLVRVLVGLVAIAVMLTAALFISGPSGTTIDPGGALIDAIAVLVLLAVLWSLWRDRARLF
jgi:hypothetical protein